MTDFATSDMSAPVAPLSTQIDTETATSPSGGGQPRTLPSDEKPSLRDTISTVVKEDGEAKEKAADAPATDENPKAEDAKPDKARDETGKFSQADKKNEPAPEPAKVEPQADKPAPQEKTEGKRYPEPPAKFLPDSREVWRNVPRSVQRDIDVMVRDHEESTARFKETTERYESIRQYDDLARQNGRELKDSLAKVHEIESAIQRNPIAGLNKILMEIGPRKADGQPVSLMDVAQFIVSQGPQGYQQMVAEAQRPQQQQQDPRVQHLEQQLADVQTRHITEGVIEPFKASHTRYAELQDDIALFLQSGKIPASLSPAEKLEAAYDMAERINPPSHVTAPAAPDPEPSRLAVEDLSGTKSIKSAPGSVSTDIEAERGGSIRDLLQDELRRQKRS